MRVDAGSPPVVEPTSAAELAEVVRDVASADVIGTGTLAALLPMHGDAEVVVSTRSMDEIVDYSPDDQVVTVRAGCRVDALESVLAGSGQETVFDPWWPDATVGGVVAAGLNGFRRPFGRSLRDVVLGVELVTGGGEVVRAGGRTVKNVTGYDVTRFVAGSLGRLGVLTEVTLRCRPRPAEGRWFVIDGRDSSPASTASLRHCDVDLLLFEGRSVETAAAARAVRGEVASPQLVADATAVPAAALHGHAAARVSVPPARLAELLAAVPPSVRWTAEPLVGLLHLDAGDDGEALSPVMDAVRRCHGRALRYSGPVRELLEATAPTDEALADRVADAFDPRRRLDWRTRLRRKDGS